ncbi:hypothetical protein E4634_02420 [Mangrovimicrobium sediminis]|uniref:Lipoprotein n=1 Tax=Mangrovimicrobium sediminis TaxID=2562682 RepID=A0A4Z0M899_9GAMM|nr:hypothetical protein [Haliea sp. SAOS-164]TGD75749.1 hypothetical protein E4634_02420 [Haliea sp. SAOS-164]
MQSTDSPGAGARRVHRGLATLACASLLLAGCFGASNPTQPSSSQTPPTASNGPGGAGGMPGGSPEGSPDGHPDGHPDGSPDGSPDGVLGGTSPGGAGEPGFEPGGDLALPDMNDNTAPPPSLPDFNQPDPAAADARGTGPVAATTGDPATGTGAETGAGAGLPDAAGVGLPGGGEILTTAEQVAILDAQLDQGTAVFDDMILDEQEKQRSSARDNASAAQDAARNTPARHEPYENAVARKDGGLYGSTGSSGGGGGAGSAPMPSGTAKYPAPGDIPSGADDDVVARQLREAAQREPDPAVREKLWDEYRKYKGIGQ